MSLLTMGVSGDDASGPLINFNFTTLAALPATVTFTRASSATSLRFDGTGSAAVVGNNVPRLSASGLLIEETRTNFLGVTDAPATQTSGSLGTGTYTLWVLGSGSCAVTAGTGTATGLGTATAGAPNNFTVTGAGTFTFTVAGSLTQFQCELGAFATSYIPNAGAAGSSAARAAEVATMPLAGTGFPAAPATATALAKLTTAAGNTTTQVICQMDDGTANNRFLLYRSGAGNITIRDQSGGVTRSDIGTGATATNTTFQIWGTFTPSIYRAQAIGQNPGSSGAGALPTGLATLRFGTENTGAFQLDGLIQKLQFFNRDLGPAQAAALAAAL